MTGVFERMACHLRQASSPGRNIIPRRHSTRFASAGMWRNSQGKDVRGWRHNRMWFLFQSLMIFAVVASNIHWQWTPIGYLEA